MSYTITVDCPECEGEGVVWYLDFLGYDGSMRDHEEECPECNGTGKVEKEVKPGDDEYDPDLDFEDHEERPL